MRLAVRRATASECGAAGGSDLGWVLTEDTQFCGQLYLATRNGCIFAHSWMCKSSDPHGAARLFLAARRFIREAGLKKFYIHFEENGGQTRRFWERYGKKVFEVYEVILEDK